MVRLGNHLSQDEYNDNETRQRLLDQGAEAIEQNVSDIIITNRNLTFCNISVRGSEESLQALKEFLDESGIGECDLDLDPRAPDLRIIQ